MTLTTGRKKSKTFIPLEALRNNGSSSGKETLFFRTKSLAGFTLIELLLVCIIMGVLLGVTIPRVRGTFTLLEIKDECRSLYSLIKYAQDSAIMETSFYRLNIDIPKDKYWLTKKDNQDEEYAQLQTSLGKTHHLSPQVKFEDLTFTDQAKKDFIDFCPDGSVDEATIYLSNKEKDMFAIEITGRIGHLRIKKIK